MTAKNDEREALRAEIDRLRGENAGLSALLEGRGIQYPFASMIGIRPRSLPDFVLASSFSMTGAGSPALRANKSFSASRVSNVV